jgi:arylsulfatase A-like enzyme
MPPAVQTVARARHPWPLAWLALWLLVVAGCSGRESAAPSAHGAVDSARGFDLLLITVDTLRADRLGCYGYERARTPAIDALAARGVRFEQAVCGSPVTLPSHATIMTGLDAPDHGVRHNGTFRLGEEQRTLAEVLREAGYRTAAFVGSFVLDRRYGLAQGFEHYDDRVEEASATPSMGQYNERSADRVVDAASAWIERQLASTDRAPFFVWVHLFDPHAPYRPPAEQAAHFPDSPYDGEIEFCDTQIARLVELLERRDALDRTLVVLTSDHGEGLGEHDELTHTILIYDSTVRVPLIFSNPALFGRGRIVDDRLAGSVDIFPTVTALLEVETEPSGPGRDLLAGPGDPDRSLYVESLVPLLDYGWSSLHGLRRLGDKLIRAPTPEYYDLRRDPAELRNLHATAEEASRLAERLDRRMADWPDPRAVIDSQATLDPEERQRLEALGYLRDAVAEAPAGDKDPKEMMALWSRMHRAGQLSLAGDDETAIGEIRAVIEQDPTSAKAWYTAVRIYDRAQRFGEAESAMVRALELAPSADGWVILARYALNRGAVEPFETALDEAERLDPRHGGIYIGRGHRLAMEGRLIEARAEFERAVEVDPARSGPHARAQIRRIDRLLTDR